MIRNETISAKTQRAELKKMLQPIIGVNVGQALRRDVRIADLPALHGATAKHMDADSDEETGDASTFFAILDSK